MKRLGSLKKAAENPADPQNINDAKLILSEAKAARVLIPPHTIEFTGKRFVEATQTNPDAWNAALTFVDYKSSINPSLPNTPNISEADARVLRTDYAVKFPYPRAPRPEVRVFGIVPEADAAQFNEIGVNANALHEGNRYIVAQGGDVLIDGLQLKSVVFVNTHIYYRGGPIILSNVYFLNCTFEIEQSANAQGLAVALLAPVPSTSFNAS